MAPIPLYTVYYRHADEVCLQGYINVPGDLLVTTLLTIHHGGGVLEDVVKADHLAGDTCEYCLPIIVTEGG